uniref:NADH-ubiquinone oxidoreductase chain 3 n=1 Tax=Scolia bicincta TaxID=427966 RepID=A0A1L2D326_9HYME|nr:NADH dehydrogenase subunit 3 [Scolia bicincta]
MLFMFMILSFIFSILSLMLIFINFILNKVENWIFFMEKASPYECGFEQQTNPKNPLSIHFFLISLIFLIFDVEITLLIPLVISMKLLNMFSFIKISLLVILILFIGVLIEYYSNSFKWMM